MIECKIDLRNTAPVIIKIVLNKCRDIGYNLKSDFDYSNPYYLFMANGSISHRHYDYIFKHSPNKQLTPGEFIGLCVMEDAIINGTGSDEPNGIMSTIKPCIVKERINILVGDLNHFKHTYYILQVTLVSDSYYAQLFRELQELERQNPELIRLDSPTQNFGVYVKKYVPLKAVNPKLKINRVDCTNMMREFEAYCKKDDDTRELSKREQAYADKLAASTTESELPVFPMAAMNPKDIPQR